MTRGYDGMSATPPVPQVSAISAKRVVVTVLDGGRILLEGRMARAEKMLIDDPSPGRLQSRVRRREGGETSMPVG